MDGMIVGCFDVQKLHMSNPFFTNKRAVFFDENMLVYACDKVTFRAWG